MHVLLTGASSGIGEALAIRFAKEGYDLSLVARRQVELERVAAAAKAAGASRVEIHPCDLSHLDLLSGLVAEAETRLGPVGVLVNNAGMEIVNRTTDIGLEAAETLFRLNVLAPFRLIRAVLPGMVERRAGTIVDVASVAAYSHPPLQTYYSASKAALAAASVSLRSELRGTGVHVVTVYPGPVRTAMGARALAGYATNPSRGLPWGSPEGAAERILTAVRRKQSSVVYPRFYWLPRWFPGVTRFLMDRVPAVAAARAEAGIEPEAKRETRDSH